MCIVPHTTENMDYFNRYVSNTCAGSANQLFFSTGEGEIRTGRVFYKITVGGEYAYSLLFSNIIDSTYGDGSRRHCNLICDSWQIHSARVGKCSWINPDREHPYNAIYGGHPNAAGCKAWADALYEKLHTEKNAKNAENSILC